MAGKPFDRLLINAVDEALGLLGDSARQSTYYHLERKFKVSKSNIPRQLRQFEEALDKIFGLGAKYIEISIMRNLYEKTGRPVEWREDNDLIFWKYIVSMKKSYTEPIKNS